MRLAPFIQANLEPILAEWEAFARTLYPPSSGMTSLLLRDHAQQILAAVVADLSTYQTRAEQAEKSKGRAPESFNAPETAAQTHAVLRAQSGIDINQLAAEYRALRASVLRLWERACQPGAEALQDSIRFNEAIDQALAESISFFNAQVERSRNLLLGMLGHDMRSPLNAIVLTASSLAESNHGEEVSEAVDILLRSGASIKALLDDLVDFNRTKLGLGIHIEVVETNLGSVFANEVKLQQAAHPTRRIILEVEGEVRGRWDGKRLQQVLRNLVSNACTYGLKEEPIRVALHGEEAGIHFEVKNRGAAIDPATAEHLFNPLQRGDLDSGHSYKEGLGLGLYIVREIVRAHGGEVELRSDAAETVFSVRLPRIVPPAPEAAAAIEPTVGVPRTLVEP
jgi:signal transduction histidine kinase